MTNTWHEGDAHNDAKAGLKIFIDCDGQPADTDRQRYFRLPGNSRHMTEEQRREVIINAMPIRVFTVTL